LEEGNEGKSWERTKNLFSLKRPDNRWGVPVWWSWGRPKRCHRKKETLPDVYSSGGLVFAATIKGDLLCGEYKGR